MPFAIYRHEKIKTAGALAASANHMTRAVPTPNADPRRAQMNRVFIGSDDPPPTPPPSSPPWTRWMTLASAAGLTASSPSRSC